MNPSTLLSTLRDREEAAAAEQSVTDKLWLEFGSGLRTERHARGIPLHSFAKAMGFTPAFLSMLESGSRKWSIKNAEKAVRIIFK